jgi:hypothetical protein
MSWTLRTWRWDSNLLPLSLSDPALGRGSAVTCGFFYPSCPFVPDENQRFPMSCGPSTNQRLRHGWLQSGRVVDAFALPVPGQGPDRLAAESGRAGLATRSLGLQRVDKLAACHPADRVERGWCLLGELEDDVSAQRGLRGGAVANPGAAGRTLRHRAGPRQRPAYPLAPWNLPHRSPGGVVPRCLPGRGQGDQSSRGMSQLP